jgi:Tol biopolymer transport system component
LEYPNATEGVIPGNAIDRLYVRDVVSNSTRVVPGSALTADHGVKAPDLGRGCGVSDDGNRVAYATTDSHASADRDAAADVYAYDFDRRAWTLVSAEGEGSSGALGSARAPVMTPDGRYVAFSATAGLGAITVPVPPDRERAITVGTGDPRNVFVRDLAEGRTTLVSRPTGCDTLPPTQDPGLGGGLSSGASISDDGRYVAFASQFTELDPSAPRPGGLYEDASPTAEVYLRDVLSCRTRLISRASGPDGAPADQGANDPSVSPDGRYVAFASWADTLDKDANGNGPGERDIYIRDWKSGRTALVSRVSGLFGESANSGSHFPKLSADKGRVAFMSRADNLVATPTGRRLVYYRETIGSRGLLPADLPGRPRIRDLELIAHGAYRRGRALLGFALSEFARLSISVTGPGGGRRFATRTVGREGRNRIRLRRGLSRGRYRISIRAIDFNRERTARSLVLKAKRR